MQTMVVDRSRVVVCISPLIACRVPSSTTVNDLFVVFLYSIHINFLRLLASRFMRETGLEFSVFVGSLCGLGIKVTMAPQKELGNVTSVSILWNNLRRIVNHSSLKVW